MTLAGYNLILEDLRSKENELINVLFVLSWIFIGNWILLKFLFAILLESFTLESDIIEKENIFFSSEARYTKIMMQEIVEKDNK